MSNKTDKSKSRQDSVFGIVNVGEARTLSVHYMARDTGVCRGGYESKSKTFRSTFAAFFVVMNR